MHSGNLNLSEFQGRVHFFWGGWEFWWNLRLQHVLSEHFGSGLTGQEHLRRFCPPRGSFPTTVFSLPVPWHWSQNPCPFHWRATYGLVGLGLNMSLLSFHYSCVDIGCWSSICLAHLLWRQQRYLNQQTLWWDVMGVFVGHVSMRNTIVLIMWVKHVSEELFDVFWWKVILQG